MDIVFLLVPLALLLVAIAIGGFFWAVSKNQFDDLQGPGHAILLDDDEPIDAGGKADPPGYDRQNGTEPGC